MFKKSSQGGMEIFIVLVVIVMSIVLAGGQFMFDGITPDQNGSNSAAGGGTKSPEPTKTASSSAGGPIEILSVTCDNTAHLAAVSAAFRQQDKGYYSFGLKESGAFQWSYEVDEPVAGKGFNVGNSDGFNTKPWQIKLFKGGTKNGDNWSGGTLTSSKDMEPTKCK